MVPCEFGYKNKILGSPSPVIPQISRLSLSSELKLKFLISQRAESIQSQSSAINFSCCFAGPTQNPYRIIIPEKPGYYKENSPRGTMNFPLCLSASIAKNLCPVIKKDPLFQRVFTVYSSVASRHCFASFSMMWR